MKKSTLTIAILSIGTLTLPSCNTMVGVGLDLRKLGETMEQKSSATPASGTYTPPSNKVPAQ